MNLFILWVMLLFFGLNVVYVLFDRRSHLMVWIGEMKCRIVKEVVEGPAHNLLESVAQLVASTTLTKHPQISAVRVKVGKPHVAVPGSVDYLGVEILRYRRPELPWLNLLFLLFFHHAEQLFFFFLSKYIGCYISYNGSLIILHFTNSKHQDNKKLEFSHPPLSLLKFAKNHCLISSPTLATNACL